MKHIIILGVCLFISVIFWIGCKKSQQQTIDNNASVVGIWELRKTSAAMNPNPTVYPEGNGNKYKFTKTNYELYVNGVLDKTGTYEVVADAGVSASVCLVIPEGQYARRIIFDNNQDPKTFFHIIGNTLHFISGCYAVDAGYTREFMKY